MLKHSLILCATLAGTMAAAEERGTESPLVIQAGRFTCKAYRNPQARLFKNHVAEIQLQELKKFPYLYEGTFEEQTAYLEEHFFKAESAVLFVVFEGTEVIAVSRAMGVDEKGGDLSKAFERGHLNPTEYFYIQDALIKAHHRAQYPWLFGFLVSCQEEFARKFLKNYRYTAFATVKRSAHDPRRPNNYHELEPIADCFYSPLSSIQFSMTWKYVNTGKETKNDLDLWYKKL